MIQTRGSALDARQLKAMLLALPVGRDDVLTGQRARRQRQEQRSEFDRTDRFAVSDVRCGLRRRPVIG